MNRKSDDDKYMIVSTVVFYILLAVIVIVLVIFDSVGARAVEEPESAYYVCAIENEAEFDEAFGPPSIVLAKPRVEVENRCAVTIPREMKENGVRALIQVKSENEYYDVPLDKSLQDHIFELCEEYEVDPAIVMSVIRKESMYKSDAIGDSGNSFGLMQIQKRYHEARMERLDCDDLLDPYQNVEVGIDLLAELIDMDRGIEWALMCYNGGYAYANERRELGIVSAYAETVLNTSKSLEKVSR